MCLPTSLHDHRDKRLFFFLVCLAAIPLVGCAAVTPVPNVQPMPLPDAWNGASTTVHPGPSSETPSSETLATWWRQLEDPVLDLLVERVLAGNVDLESAAARVEESRARRGLSRSELGPSVSASFSGGHTEPLADVGTSSDQWAAGLDMAWEADLFGAKRLNLMASQADLEVEIENLKAIRVSLVAETVVAYAELRTAEARLQVLDESLTSREETSQLTDWRAQAGLASRLEVNQAASSLSQAQAERPLIEQSAIDAHLRLDLLAGEAPGALDGLLKAVGSRAVLPVPPPDIAAGIPADTLRQRPDVGGAERQLTAAAARLGAAEAGRYPSLRLSGSLDAQSTDLEDLFDLDSMLGHLLAGLTAPIFESGRIRQNIAVRDAQWQQATLAYRSTVLGALSETERALASFRASQERLAALEVAAEVAAEAAELADQRYEAGLVDLLSVLDTERTLFNLEEQRTLAQGDLLKAFSNLYRALGGGWESHPHETSPVPNATQGASHVG